MSGARTSLGCRDGHPLIVVCVALAAACYGWIEAGWLRRGSSKSRSRGSRRCSTDCGSGTSRTFTSGPRSRGATARPSARCVGSGASSGPRLHHRRLVSHLAESRAYARSSQTRCPFVVLGNHDVAVTRDPFSRAAELNDLDRDAATSGRRGNGDAFVARGSRSPVSTPPLSGEAMLPDPTIVPTGELRILLCHFPRVVERLPANGFDLILAGHLHAGQICLPFPGRRITLAHPRRRVAGLYETEAGRCTYPGNGTTFVPLRFFARPEVTELVLRRRSDICRGGAAQLAGSRSARIGDQHAVRSSDLRGRDARRRRPRARARAP